jgi:hypothetical protein
MIQHAVFLRLWEPTANATGLALQNFYRQGPITIGADSYQFLDFTVDGLANTGTADQNELTLTFPGLTAISTAADDAMAEGWLATITVYQFDQAAKPDTPPAGQVVLLTAIGEVTGGSEDFPATVTITVGSALESLGAQVPPRRFTSALVGTPCRL